MSTATVTDLDRQDEPAEFATTTVIHVRLGGQQCPVAVSCEPTATTGLVIAPAVMVDEDGHPHFRDTYQLIHERSGRFVVPTNLPVRHLHLMAESLGQSGVDWTQPYEVLTAADNQQAKTAAYHALEAAETAYLKEVGQ